jgi:hypothetical protein
MRCGKEVLVIKRGEGREVVTEDLDEAGGGVPS